MRFPQQPTRSCRALESSGRHTTCPRSFAYSRSNSAIEPGTGGAHGVHKLLAGWDSRLGSDSSQEGNEQKTSKASSCHLHGVWTRDRGRSSRSTETEPDSVTARTNGNSRDSTAGLGSKQWAAIRAHCQGIADRSAAHIAIGPRETSMVQTCGSLSSPPEIAEPSNTPNNAAVAPMSLPTPVATPQSSLVSRRLRTRASGAGSALPS